ncbi:cysteine desulfurase [archaeon]|jgi:cysteine desulfurase / selenocysteine lyase|nr:cysteine desulfurase [Candidatus Woesearchaeota archaeon]MBT4351708.1 cysteine desulfurase [archaeon]MBT4647530.1 cysteine desulfurase [archaeon]MBT6821973.1 cysteine desulfurase [archaeon]MBT7393107.1 cysteine desulfurase [archaeon]
MKNIRNDFPFINNRIENKPIIYFDSACQTLRPKQVIDETIKYYTEFSSCGGRSSHKLAKITTEKVEKVREDISKFFNANNSDEIVFIKNTTEGLNIVARSFGLKKGDVVITSKKEHNSNLVPWLDLERKIAIRRIQIDFDDYFDMEAFKQIINKNIKLVSVVQTSNIDGTSTPIKEIIKISHENNVPVLVDGAQSAPHTKIDLKKIDADFFVCSGHKMLGPSGTGILYGKYKSLNNLENFVSGGDSVEETTYDSYIPKCSPGKFEAGLQNYSGIFGLGAAIKYLNKIGMDQVQDHVFRLNTLVTKKLKNYQKLKILGPYEPKKRSSIYGFNIQGFFPNDISDYVEKTNNIMIRSGFHCCHSWFKAHNMNGSARASFYIYNTKEECKKFIDDIEELVNFIK